MRAIDAAVRFILRAVITAIGLFIHCMEKLADGLLGVGRKTQYVREGRCTCCGVCCRSIAIRIPPFAVRRKWLVRLISGWHRYRYNFVMIDLDVDNDIIYKCLHQRPDGSCGIYLFRPRLCREYPKQKLYGRPEVYPSCGFYFVRRQKGDIFQKVMDDVRMNDAQKS